MSPAVLAVLSVGAVAASDEEFQAVIDTLRRELAPTTALEAILVDQVAQYAARLRRSARREPTGDRMDRDWLRYESMAERGFWRALNAIQKGRRPVKSAAPKPTPDPIVTPEPAPAPLVVEPPSPPTLAAIATTPAPALAPKATLPAPPAPSRPRQPDTARRKGLPPRRNRTVDQIPWPPSLPGDFVNVSILPGKARQEALADLPF